MVAIKVSFTEGESPLLRDVVSHLVSLLELADLAERLARTTDRDVLVEVNAWCGMRLTVRRKQGVVFPPIRDQQNTGVRVVEVGANVMSAVLRWDGTDSSRVVHVLGGLLRTSVVMGYYISIDGDEVDVFQSSHIGAYFSEVAAGLPHVSTVLVT